MLSVAVDGPTTGVWGDKPSVAAMGGQTAGASGASGGGEWTVVPKKKKKKKKWLIPNEIYNRAG